MVGSFGFVNWRDATGAGSVAARHSFGSTPKVCAGVDTATMKFYTRLALPVLCVTLQQRLCQTAIAGV